MVQYKCLLVELKFTHDDGLGVRNRFDITDIAANNVTASVNPPTDEFYSISGFDSN